MRNSKHSALWDIVYGLSLWLGGIGWGQSL